MTRATAQPLQLLQRLAGYLSNLRLAIGLLMLIAVASGIGTAIPQKETTAFYHQRYDPAPWLGLLSGQGVLNLQLDHVYSSGWFLALLALLGMALLLCSLRRQWPALQASLRWIEYRTPRQLSKLSLAETIPAPQPEKLLERLEGELRGSGWQIRRQPDHLAARRGVIGRVGPLLVHAGLVVLMVGAAWGALAGVRREQFLAPGRELELLDHRGRSQMTLVLKDFAIQRDPAGRPEQFRSQLRLIPASPSRGQAQAGEPSLRPASQEEQSLKGAEAVEPLKALDAEISVNHPLRYRGMTLYQADWALAAINLQLGRSPVLPLPLRSLPQMGDQVWGLVLPTRPDGSDPVLLSLSSEQGPVEVFGPDGTSLALITPGGPAVEVRGLPIRVESVLPASGILLKRDPGVPLVYSGFAIALLGGALSLIATRQLWAIADPEQGCLHVAGIANRDLTAYARELPDLMSRLAAVND